MFKRFDFLRKAMALAAAVIVIAQPIHHVSATAYSVQPGPIFMDPSTSLHGAEADKITRSLNDMIRNTPKGETIRIATLGINIENTSTALLKAYDRGVNIKIVLPATQKEAPIPKKLAQRFNRASVNDGSYVAYCVDSCYSDAPDSLMHTKIFMASKTGSSRQVTMITSKNLRTSSSTNAYNDAFVTVGDSAIYNGMRIYFEGLKLDKAIAVNPKIVGTTATYHYYPVAQLTKETDVYMTALDKVVCTGAATGYGNKNGRTKILLSNPIWLGNRIDISRRLGDLKQEGCVIQVMMSKSKSSAGVVRTLQNNSIPVKFTDRYDANGVRYLYSHSKYMTISGSMGKVNRMAKVFTGSANLSFDAQISNDNIIAEIRNDRAVHAEYANNFDMIWDQSTFFTAADIAEMSENGEEGE